LPKQSTGKIHDRRERLRMRKEKIDIPFPEKGSLVLRTDILFSLFLMSGIYAFLGRSCRQDPVLSLVR
jgi:hypothetical protein